MKKTLSLMLIFLLAALNVNAQLPDPTGDDGNDGGDGTVVFYLACYNSDGTAVFTRFPNLSPAEKAALCDNPDDDYDLIPFG